MLDPRNNVLITGGIVVDPEVVNGNILKLRIGVDYAGSEKNSQSNSGYFDVTYFLQNDDNVRNTKWVKEQVDAGNLKKGSQVHIHGRLVQERWSTEDKKNSRVVIIAENIAYVKGSGSKPAEDSASASSSPSQQELPDSF